GKLTPPPSNRTCGFTAPSFQANSGSQPVPSFRIEFPDPDFIEAGLSGFDFIKPGKIECGLIEWGDSVEQGFIDPDFCGLSLSSRLTRSSLGGLYERCNKNSRYHYPVCPIAGFIYSNELGTKQAITSVSH